VTWAHRRWRGIREDATERIVADRRDLGAELDRDELDLIVERTNPLSWSCCIVIPRAGVGRPRRLRRAVRGLGLRGHGVPVRHLRPVRLGADRGRRRPPVAPALRGADHARPDAAHGDARVRDERPARPAVHGRPAPRPRPPRPRRHAGIRGRARARHPQPRPRRREVRARRRAPRPARLVDWWPTLEELRDGAKAHRLGPSSSPPSRSSSGPAASPRRGPSGAAYLRRSLASLTENG
jgi:hypothetical protein